MRPDLRLFNRSKLAWTEFQTLLKAAWWAIPQDTIDSLIRSFPRRMAAVRAVRGYYTRY